MIPEHIAREYLERAPSLLWLIGANLVAVLVGVRFYVEEMVAVHTFLWPLYLDSPVAVLLMALSLTTLIPFLGTDIRGATTNLPLAYLHTLAFVWLVYMGIWTVLALFLGAPAYLEEPAAAFTLFGFFGIIVTHLLFVLEAYLIPHYGRTTRGALAFAGALLGINLVVDYAFGYHPPLEYDPGLTLPIISLGIAILTLGLAAFAFDPYEPSNSTVPSGNED